jgi:hypothetical protein
VARSEGFRAAVYFAVIAVACVLPYPWLAAIQGALGGAALGALAMRRQLRAQP